MPAIRQTIRIARLRSGWCRVSSGDQLAVGILCSLPILLYVPFALFGHPLVPGDDLIQNYPLRVLAGTLIHSGHLPTWDPFIWGGTPLLAGWNAGALYPGTWLFAVLPGVAAWTVNLVLAGVISGVGVFVLLRLLRCRSLAALFGGLCFTYTGFMSGQLDHIGMVQGTGYVPWMLIAIELLIRSPTWRSTISPLLLFAASVGLCVLAGEPRAISSAVIIDLIYVIARSLQLGWHSGWKPVLHLTSTTAAGAALGTGISAIQWLPGLTFVARSQRTLDAYQAFGAGSLSWQTIAHNLLVPFLLGGNGNLGLPYYVGSYNLPEVMIGVGLLPLVAACAYLPDLCANGLTTLRQLLRGVRGARDSPDKEITSSIARTLGVWYTMGLIGLVLTLGNTTPIGHLLIDIPLYGGERLQNRNAVIFDLALAVLLGYFVDDLATTHKDPGGQRQFRLNPLRTHSRRLLAVLPLTGCVLFVLLAYLRPLGLQRHSGVALPITNLFVRLSPYLAFTVVFAVTIAVFVFVADRLSHRSQVLFLTVLVCVDIGVYLVNASYATAPSAVLTGPTSLSTQLATLTGGGRFALYNPLEQAVPLGENLGTTDLNILRGVMSVQGYGSIVSGTYQNATNTHILETLDPTVLDDGLADSLDLRVLLTPPIYLGEPIPPHSAIPVAAGPAVTATGIPGSTSHVPAPPQVASGPWTVAPGREQEWFLPSTVSVARVTIVVNKGYASVPSTLDVGLASPGHAPKFESLPIIDGAVHLTFATSLRAESVSIRDPGTQSVTIGAVLAVTQSPDERFLLDGRLQGSIVSPQWTLQGRIGTLSVFVNHDADGLAWLKPSTSHASNEAPSRAGSVTTNVNPTSGAEQMLATAKRPSLLVRSVAYQPGWTAELTPINGGPTKAVPVEPLGLLQAIRIPAGHFRITWLYASRSLVVGGALTLGSIAVVFALTIGTLFSRPRRKRLWYRSSANGTAH